MEKSRVVRALKEMANLLEILEAGRFEYTAFRNAASAVEDWTEDLTQTVLDGKVTDIPTIGKGTGGFITELVEHGSAKDLDNIRSRVPEQLPTLLRFRGLGPKKVKTLWHELGIEGLDDLERAINNGEVAKIKGFGPKSIDSLRDSIDYFRIESIHNAAAKNTLTDTHLQQVPMAVAPSGKVFAGTSGYSYPKWKGNFYPAKAKTAELLSHYANALNSVEINNTFYRFPSEKVVQQWKVQTSEGFAFSLKTHRRITHQMRLNENSKTSIKEFIERCSILGSRLGCILFQLPPDLERDDERLNNLLTSLIHGPRYAVEFRHKSWHNDAVYQQLSDHNVACVAGDSANDSATQVVTANFVYARLRKDRYTETELNRWHKWFARQQKDNRDILVYLKHDDTGHTPNAITKLWPPKLATRTRN